MKKLVMALTIFASLILTQDVFSTTSVEYARTIKISGPISDLEMEKDKLLEYANKSSEPVYIIIDSPGGSVLAGLRFVQIMDRAKAKGVDIRCIVEGMAASMAMHIFGNCSTRYAFETSLLLWHPAYMYIRGAPVTQQEAERIKKQLHLITALLEERLKKELNLPLEVYEEYYYNEYFVAGHILKSMSPNFMTIIQDY